MFGFRRIYKIRYKIFAEHETLIPAISANRAVAKLSKQLYYRYSAGYEILSVEEYN